MRNLKLFLALGIVAAFFLSACAATIPRAQTVNKQVLFVCEHGNVKSLMAAEYFNEIAQQRNLPYHAISRGVAPDSDTVPPSIVSGLHADGFDVSKFHPTSLTSADLSTSSHVILIGTVLPKASPAETQETEAWTDVPAASTDFAAARGSLKSHIASLVDQLERDKAH